MAITNQQLADNLMTESTGAHEAPVSFRPTRPIVPVSTSSPVQVGQKTVTAPTTTIVGINPSGSFGIPESLLSASATQTPSLQQGRMYSLVTVSFTRDGSDPNFGSARVWFTGYQGSSTPVLMASGTTSPISFLCESTGETVIVSVQPVSPDGLTASLLFAISGTVTLSGVVSAPPAPSIAQSLVNTPTGYQFSFNFLTGLLTDVIANYRVYRNFSNTTVGATAILSIPQDTKGSASYVVQDNIGSQSVITYYYWISAVNTSGLESSLTAAQSGAVVNGGWVIPPQYGTTVAIDNANFESSTVILPATGGPPGWIANGATLSYDTVTPYQGTQSLKVAAGVIGGGAITAKRWSCKAGDQFYVSCAMKSDGTSQPEALLIFYDSSNTFVGSVGPTHGTGTSWTIDTASGVAPAGAVSFYFECASNVGSGVAYFDQCLVDRMVDPTTTIQAKGSTPSNLSTGFSYTSTTTSVTVTWTGFMIYRADGSTTAVSNGSQLITGLSSSTTYRVYPYYDDIANALHFVTVAGGTGSPAICYVSGSNTISQAQNLQSVVPLSASTGFTVATPASGSGGGSGGGSGNCLHEDMLVQTEAGIEKIIDVQIGDRVFGEQWQEVTYKKVGTAELFIRIQLTDGSQLLCTPTHPFTMLDGSDQPVKRAQDLSLSDFLITTSGVGAIKSIEVVETKARKVTLTVEPSHTFFAGKDSPTILTHNYLPS